MKNTLLALVLLLSFHTYSQLGSISGQITTASNEALPGATITLVGTVRGVQTNAKGHYILKGLKPGQYILQVSFVGYKPSKQEVSIKESEQRELNVTLNDGTELQGVSVKAQSGV
ncbi:MAG: carboxypeptidase-like regulatory domain-containing protein, partial [Aquirufa sp.]